MIWQQEHVQAALIIISLRKMGLAHIIHRCAKKKLTVFALNALLVNTYLRVCAFLLISLAADTSKVNAWLVLQATGSKMEPVSISTV